MVRCTTTRSSSHTAPSSLLPTCWAPITTWLLTTLLLTTWQLTTWLLTTWLLTTYAGFRIFLTFEVSFKEGLEERRNLLIDGS